MNKSKNDQSLVKKQGWSTPNINLSIKRKKKKKPMLHCQKDVLCSMY